VDKGLLWFGLGPISQVEDKDTLFTEEEIASAEISLPLDCAMYDPREILLLTSKSYIVVKSDALGENIEVTRYSRDRKILKINKKYRIIKHPENKSYWQRYEITVLSIVFEDGGILEIKQPDPHFIHDFQKLIAILEKQL